MFSFTKRDVKAFFLGMFTLFLINTILDWENVKSQVKRGFYDGLRDAEKTEVQK